MFVFISPVWMLDIPTSRGRCWVTPNIWIIWRKEQRAAGPGKRSGSLPSLETRFPAGTSRRTDENIKSSRRDSVMSEVLVLHGEKI